MKQGIYIIRNTSNDKKYVGSSKDLDNRYQKHLYTLRKNKSKSPLLQKDYNIFGEESFEFSIIEIVDNPHLLLDRERYYINQLSAEYNIHNSLTNKKGKSIGSRIVSKATVDGYCSYCGIELVGKRNGSKFCSDSCRGSHSTTMRRMKAVKIDFTKKLEEAKNLPSEYPQEVLDLFNKLKEGGRYGV